MKSLSVAIQMKAIEQYFPVHYAVNSWFDSAFEVLTF